MCTRIINSAFSRSSLRNNKRLSRIQVGDARFFASDPNLRVIRSKNVTVNNVIKWIRVICRRSTRKRALSLHFHTLVFESRDALNHLTQNCWKNESRILIESALFRKEKETPRCNVKIPSTCNFLANSYVINRAFRNIISKILNEPRGTSCRVYFKVKQGGEKKEPTEKAAERSRGTLTLVGMAARHESGLRLGQTVTGPEHAMFRVIFTKTLQTALSKVTSTGGGKASSGFDLADRSGKKLRRVEIAYQVTRAKVNVVIMRRNNTACASTPEREGEDAEDENYTARGTERGLYTRWWLVAARWLRCPFVDRAPRNRS